MAAAYATVANEGVWLRPHVVAKVGSTQRPAYAARRVLSPHVARQVMAMMRDVVVEGTGQEAALPGYQVAGKTGTAAKPDASGGYSKSDYVASFVGVVPATSPRLVVLVTVDEPRSGAARSQLRPLPTSRVSRSSTSRYRLTRPRRSPLGSN